MISVLPYTEINGSSSDTDEFAFETMKEARAFFDDYDIAMHWDTERQCSPVGTMRKTVFVAEIWEGDECADIKEYSYDDYMRTW